MRIYTKTGDKGETSLFDGKRVPKNDPVIEALGAVDELNCAIGVALAARTNEQLESIQCTLFELGAVIADSKKTLKSQVENLEKWIDEMEEKLPPLKAFILPGGHPAAAQLHLARSICRRAERAVVALGSKQEELIVYLNRLSDYLFMAARFTNHETETDDIEWKSRN